MSTDSLHSGLMSGDRPVDRDGRDCWSELRFNRRGPERRGYHASVIHNGKLYIHGGHDIKEGTLSSLWGLDLSKLNSLRKVMESHKH